jgi:branched-chain amino acid transport system permease protein
MGIAVARHKASAFVVSSGYAGLAGALLALAYGRLSPDLFSLTLSVDFLVMIVLGGLGSVGGAVVGALFVTALPLVLAQYSSSLPFLAAPGSGGLDPATLSRFLYGVAIILVLIFLRGGLAGAFRRLRGRGGAAAVSGAPDDTPRPTPPPTDPGQPAGPSPSRSKETAR